MYIDNKEFYGHMKTFIYACRAAASKGEERPEIPRFIGNAILLITNGLGHTHGFRNYSYLEDMKADAVENCVRYVDRFDPDRFDNPFAYFTQISYFAFIRRITREKKQSIVKGMLLANAPLVVLELQGHDAEDSEQYAGLHDYVLETLKDEYLDFSKDKIKKKEHKKIHSALDEFLEETELE